MDSGIGGANPGALAALNVGGQNPQGPLNLGALANLVPEDLAQQHAVNPG